jgi:hypothetical protein
MGAGRIPDRSDGVQMDDSWFNTVRSAMTGDIVAREAVLGVATDIAAKLGPSESYRFLKAFIAFGYWDCGDFKLHHSYNGLISAGEGWMLCDGRTVSQANYDTEHGSGHWATFVGSSPIDGLKLPDFTNRYAVGASSTTATGSGAIPTVGNASHQINMRHRHQWYYAEPTASVSDGLYDSSGNLSRLADTSPLDNSLGAKAGVAGPSSHLYTSHPNAAASLSTTQSIQPESIEFQVYMRVI